MVGVAVLLSSNPNQIDERTDAHDEKGGEQDAGDEVKDDDDSDDDMPLFDNARDAARNDASNSKEIVEDYSDDTSLVVGRRLLFAWEIPAEEDNDETMKVWQNNAQLVKLVGGKQSHEKEIDGCVGQWWWVKFQNYKSDDKKGAAYKRCFNEQQIFLRPSMYGTENPKVGSWVLLR